MKRLPRHSRPSFVLIGAVALACTLLVACDDMKQRGKVRPLQPSSFFPDGRSSRDLVPGTVPRGGTPVPFPRQRQDFSTINQMPVPLTKELLLRGQERFNIFCAPCHGGTGRGDGMIVQRGFTPPPSYHIDRLRNAPIGHFVDVITNGWGAMYSYANRVPLDDRWAIAAYIRALQLSQNAPIDALGPEDRQKVTMSQP